MLSDDCYSFVEQGRTRTLEIPTDQDLSLPNESRIIIGTNDSHRPRASTSAPWSPMDDRAVRESGPVERCVNVVGMPYSQLHGQASHPDVWAVLMPINALLSTRSSVCGNEE